MDSEIEIIEAIAYGKEDAFVMLYERYSEKVYNTAMSYAKNVEDAEEIYQSMKGSQRAKPSPELFAKIENPIAASKDMVIPPQQWRYAAAAAVLNLFMNVSALLYYNLDK